MKRLMVLGCAVFALVGCTSQGGVASTPTVHPAPTQTYTAVVVVPVSDETLVTVAASAMLSQDPVSLSRVYPSINTAGYIKDIDTYFQLDQYKPAGRTKIVSGPTDDQGGLLYKTDTPVTTSTGKPLTYHISVWVNPVQHVVSKLYCAGVDQ